jgi:outer membrane protein assembly factor BamB
MRRASFVPARPARLARLPLRLTVALALALLLGPSLLATAQEEPAATFHGNVARTGEQPGPNPEGIGSLRWRFQTEGAVRSSPVLAGGLVYFGSNDGRLYAIDAATGEPRWSHTTGGAVRTSPAVADGLVVFGSDDGYVYCLAADTGELRWRFLIGLVELTAATTRPEDLPRRTVTSSPLIIGGVAFIGSNDFTLHAIDLATGIERWNAVLSFATISAPSYRDGTLFVGTEGGVYAIDATTGHKVWRAVAGLPEPEDEEADDADDDGDGTVNEQDTDDDGDGVPDDQDGANDAGDGGDGGDGGSGNDGSEEDDGADEDEDASLAADLADGAITVSELMETPAGQFTWNVAAAPVVVDNLIYAVGFQESEKKIEGTDRAALAIGTLLQLDINTGLVTGIWYFKTWDDVLTTPAVVDGTIYLGSDRGFIYAVEAEILSASVIDFSSDSDEASELSFASNQQRWAVQTERYVGSSAAVVGETVYAGNVGGVLYALDTKTGQLRWTIQTGGPIWSSPAVKDGIVYVGSDDGFLYAIGGS